MIEFQMSQIISTIIWDKNNSGIPMAKSGRVDILYSDNIKKLQTQPRLYYKPSGIFFFYPSEEFELTANSQGAHIETHGGLIVRTLS